ncbi:MAG: transporter substrate-binding domain-containing protein [Bacteroidetes bacterium]|nr:transporter substrate-binding domain-containing protein [Bacteroidota bacterium]
MNRIFAGIFLGLLLSCGNPEPVVVKHACVHDWSDIRKDSVITVLAENSPASYFVYRGRNMGYEYELLYQFAKDMNIRLQVKMVHDLDTMIHLLHNCEGDIIAANLAITNQRSEGLGFSIPHMTTRMVLVQRKPDNYRKMKKDAIQDSLITEVSQLKGKTIHVWKHSTYFQQIHRLNAAYQLHMTIIGTEGDMITEELIRQVSDGEIDLTIADENIAQIDMNFYPNLDISLELSDDQQIAFVLRKSSHQLMDTLNYWLRDSHNKSTIGEVHRKYFERKNLSGKANKEFSSLKDGQLSPYDDLVKAECAKYGWDWRLILAIMYQESKFETWKVSWAGAFGLFGFMPGTAEQYGISPLSSPAEQIRAALEKLDKNYDEWAVEIKDSSECMNFTLATFNSGRGHIDDARRLCEKYGKDKNTWTGHVNEMLLNLSKPLYYRDDLVKNGYCRGVETYEYIIEVRQRYEEYKAAFPDGNPIALN